MAQVAEAPDILLSGTEDVLLFRRLFHEFMAEHGQPDAPQASLDEIEHVVAKTRYLP